MHRRRELSAQRAASVAEGLALVYASLWLVTGVGAVAYLSPSGYLRLMRALWRVGQEHLTIAMAALTVLPVALLACAVLARRRPLWALGYLAAFAASFLLVPFLLARWPQLVPSWGWALLGLALATGMVGAWGLLRPLTRADAAAPHQPGHPG